MRTTRAVLLLAATACATATSGGPAGPRVHGAYPPRNLAELRPLTRPEQSGFTATSTYDDVLVFLDTLVARSPFVHVEALGRTTQGREIPLVVVSRPKVRSAAEARRSNRPIVYLQGNIHGGEVEGKEAILSLLRDLTRDPYLNVLDSLVIVAVPIYNADGNEAWGPQERNRSDQNGPASIGQRPNGQGLDLNRDYIKAEAPETRAALDFIRAWNPDVFVDLHTTNGSFHGYGLTYAPSLNPAAIFSGPYTRDTILPGLRQGVQMRFGLATFPYGNFISQDSVERGWFTYDHRPRFGTNYYGLRGRVAILSEAYSHDPFRTRIASTYSFVSQLLSIVAANAEDFLEVGREADRRTTAFASTPGSSPRIAIRSRLTRQPYEADVIVEEVVRTGDTTRTEPGLRAGLRRTGRERVVRMPVFDRFDPELETTLPHAWVIPVEQRALLEPLRRHGVFVEQVTAPTRVRAAVFTIDSIARNPRPFQGHHEVRLRGTWSTDSTTIETSALVVRAAQPLGILALYLLEPQSDDGLTTWNFLDQWLNTGARFPIVRVLDRMDVPLRSVP